MTWNEIILIFNNTSHWMWMLVLWGCTAASCCQRPPPSRLCLHLLSPLLIKVTVLRRSLRHDLRGETLTRTHTNVMPTPSMTLSETWQTGRKDREKEREGGLPLATWPARLWLHGDDVHVKPGGKAVWTDYIRVKQGGKKCMRWSV